MMTQTSLSAATRIQRDESARNSSFQPQVLVYPEARRALAHPRNPFPVTSHPPLATEVLIATADASSIGILSDQRESKGLSYRYPLRLQRLDFCLLVTRHSSLACPAEDHRRRRVAALLIHGSAIKSQRNQFEYNNLQISNRRQTGV
jgi:hypothetical protein